MESELRDEQLLELLRKIDELHNSAGEAPDNRQLADVAEILRALVQRSEEMILLEDRISKLESTLARIKDALEAPSVDA